MNLPNLPSKFSGGETLTAAKLNALVDWMSGVAQLLPSLQVSAGPGLSYSRGGAGTTLSLARGFLQGGGSSQPEDGGGDAGNFSRRLFNWTAAETPGQDEDDAPPSYSVEVSDGLVLIRPHALDAAPPKSAAVVVADAKDALGKVSVKVPKYAAEFLPELSSEFAVLKSAELSDSSEPAVSTEISVDVSVPGYTLSRTGTASVVTGVATGSKTASITIPAMTLTSSSEYLQSVVLNLKGKSLSADPVGKPSWTETVVTTDSGSTITVPAGGKSCVTVSSTAKTVNATVSGVATGASGTAVVPTGYTLAESGTASTKTAKVAVEIPEKILETTSELLPQLLCGGSVNLTRDGEEALTLDVEGAGEIGTAKLAEETEILGAEGLAAAAPGKPILKRVEGKTFQWGGGEKIVFLDVTGFPGGASFAWRIDDLDTAAESTEYFSEAPQELRLNVRGELADAASGDSDENAKMFYVSATVESADADFEQWKVSVPMAYIAAADNGGPYVEPLTWGCVEVTPPLKITLNGGSGGGAEAAAPAALAASARVIPEALNDALSVAEKDAYGLENQDFDFSKS